jgi:predicted enzyme related to lactoylglutathione lyase
MSRLAHVMIFVKHLEPMSAFYSRVFGLTPEPSSDARFLVLKSDTGAGIALHVLPYQIAECIQLTDPPVWRDETAYKVCFDVSDLEAYRQRILAAGGQAKDPWQWEGTRFCECTDPEGNVIQIFRRPA